MARSSVAYQPTVYGTRYMVSAGHYLATQAAHDILDAGGNAVDAGVAANLALGVLQSDMVNIAGVAPILLYRADGGDVLTITGLGPWPRAATLDLFVNEHGGEIPLGLRRTVVPAAPDANIMALQRFGTMSFGEVAVAAIRYARDGFPMHPMMSAYIAAYEHQYRMWPDNKAIYLPRDRPPAAGEVFVQADLARSLQFMADEEIAARSKGRDAGLAAARDAFYRGDIAQTILRYHRENDGLLSEADMADFRSTIEPPVKKTFHGLGAPIEVYTCGPWSQGPVLLQMMALLDGFALAAIGHNTTEYIHVVAEAMKLALADRERYYGDPLFVDVPLERLLSDAYNAERRQMIRPDEAWTEMPPAGDFGNEPGPAWQAAQSMASPPMPGDTSYVCVVDRDGNVFSSNPSDVTWESPVIPGTGLCPSSRGSQSWAVPGHASSVAPGKRPRLTPNPALAMRDGEFVMPIGTPGGDTQCQAVLQVLLNMELFGMEVQDAVEAPRFITHSQPDTFSPHTAYPGRLTIEGRIDGAAGDALAGKGHTVEWLDDMTWKTAGVCLVRHDLESGVMAGAADPRRPSRAMGW
jgi:gamma-glutamyltranspeptidase/glutathione hydrolase